jgi:hypothetical protein
VLFVDTDIPVRVKIELATTYEAILENTKEDDIDHKEIQKNQMKNCFYKMDILEV